MSEAEYLRQQTIEDFKRWRQDIPDYERRLYDRIKSINARTVINERLGVASLILNILVLFGIGYIVLWGMPASLSPLAPSAAGLPAGEKWLNRFLLKFIRIQQKKIHKLLNSLRTYASLRNQAGNEKEHSELLSEVLKRTTSQLNALDEEIKGLNDGTDGDANSPKE